jgi:hypothetical protein
MTVRKLVITLSLLAFVASSAFAGQLFDGQTVQLTYEYPALGVAFDTTTLVVGPGAEIGGFPAGDARTAFDFSDTNIYVTYLSDGTWSIAAFNGWHVFDVNGTIPAITSVTVNGATNMAGFDASRITFDANNIWVNWNNLPFDTNTVVSLDVNGGSSVPEPATFVLLGGALVGLGLLKRRR